MPATAWRRARSPPPRMRDEFRFRAHRRAHRGLRRASAAGRALGVAGDAQRGVRAARPRRGLPAAARPPTSTTSPRSPTRSARGRQRHDAVQGATRFERADECDPVSAAHRRGQHAARGAATVAGQQHRRRRLPGAARRARCSCAGDARAVLGAGGAARAVAVGARVARRARHGARAAAGRRRERWPR